MTHTIACFHEWGWCLTLRHAMNRSVSHLGCAVQAHFRIIQVWPDWPGVDLLDAFESRAPTRSLSNRGRVRVGLGGGSSSNVTATSGGVWGKKQLERMSVTSSCVCTNLFGPFRNGTLDTLCPCLQVATSQSWAFLI